MESSRFAEEVAKLLNKDVKIFEPEEAAALTALAEMQLRSPKAILAWVTLYEMMGHLGRFGASIQGVVKWFIYMMAAWLSFKAGLAEWIIEIVKGSPK